MSRLLTGISGALALALISGAAQFALGRDLGRDLSQSLGRLPQIIQPLPFSLSSLDTVTPSVNRGAKADRTTGPAGSPALTRTVSFKLNGVSDMAILVRVPVVAANSPAVSSSAKPITRKPMAVACEPVVSVLTEVAKILQPGRCVT